MTALFAAALFASAFLLFVVQPMAGKALLPPFGGTPDVWNACMFFFQATLLGGYLYANLLTRRLPVRAQAALHLGVVALAAAVAWRARIGAFGGVVDGSADALALAESHPLGAILGTLAVQLGLPCLILSSTSPLLQSWFAATARRDPYFLYSASNLGSLVGLLAYPLLLEPFLPLSVQARLWPAGYVLLGAAIAAAAWLARDAAAVRAPPVPAAAVTGARRAQAPLWLWVALAFVPSSALLGATTFLSSDLAPIPLLWVVPLAIYLGSFIVALRLGARRLAGLGHLTAFLSILVLLSLSESMSYPVWLVMPIHLAWLAAASLMCHARLMALRPHVGRLTTFYLCVAAGGVGGGLFNGVLAPLVFPGMYEYPLVVLLACALRPGELREPWRPRALGHDVALAAAVAAASLLLGWLASRGHALPPPLRNLVVLGIPLVICLRFVDARRRFALMLVAALAGQAAVVDSSRAVLLRERNFFGSLRVVRDLKAGVVALYHGRTVHGTQSLDPRLRAVPTTYYSREGPAGDVFAATARSPARIGLIGLGAGTLAAYARAGDTLTFFEINPQILAVARDSGFFTYLADSRASRIEYRLGDGRLLLAREPGQFDLLVLDAFGSDAIPVHLLTREALAVYFAHLRPGGILAVHVSNVYLELARVLGPMAAQAGAAALFREDAGAGRGTGPSPLAGRLPSAWVALARDPEALRSLSATGLWRPIAESGLRPWTDDFVSLLGVLRLELDLHVH